MGRWYIVPRVGTGTSADPFRPMVPGARVPGDRVESVSAPGNARCLIAVELSSYASLDGSPDCLLLADANALGDLIGDQTPARRRALRDEAAAFGLNPPSSVRDVVRGVGRLLSATFDERLHLASTPVPPTGSFLVDTFTDTTGVLLQSHTGETGGAWTKHPNANVSVDGVIEANRLRTNDPTNFSSEDAFYYASGVPATAQYTVEGVFRPITFTNSEPYIWGRLSTSALTGYSVAFDAAGIYLAKKVAGASTSLGTYAFSPSTGVDYTVAEQLLDATKKVFLDGVERISSTDNAVTAAGRAGVQIRNITGATTGIHLAGITATDYVPPQEPMRRRSLVHSAAVARASRW